MKLELNEKTLNAYINEAIRLEMSEILDESNGTSRWYNPFSWGRARRNNKWGYEWDDNETYRQNILNRRLNKAQIKAKGYKNYDEYQAGESPIEEPEQEQQMEIPAEYPYKANRQKTGQFQTWFNDNMGGKLVVDGIWGPRTEAAYQQWLSSQNEQ